MDEAGLAGRQVFGTGRVTSQRATIAAAASELGTAFTVDDLSSVARARDGSLGVATVYRAVAAMEESGWLERVGERSGCTLYARCVVDGHHHHVICTACGRMEPAECPVADFVSAANTPGGFVVTDHDVTLYGLCPDCRTGTEA